MSENKHHKLIIGSIVALVLAAAITLCTVLPMSWSYIEYHEYGFLRQKSTGQVDTDTVYTGGKYFTGPDYEFKKFKADAHWMVLDDIAIFTRDKLEVKITVHMQYFIRKDELPLLHDRYDIDYENVMRSSAVDALKGAIPVFNTKELISKRKEVEALIFKAVRERLGGTCCRPNCDEYAYACEQGCRAIDSCTDADKGNNVNVGYLQLADVSIPSTVLDRYMETLVLQEKVEREHLIQTAKVIRKNTQALVQDIRNQAREIHQDAYAESSKITTISKAEYTSTIETARSVGLTRVFTNVGLTEQQHKNSFDYLRTLIGHGNVKLTVDFQQKIAGNL